jgi:hypothetical protein
VATTWLHAMLWVSCCFVILNLSEVTWLVGVQIVDGHFCGKIHLVGVML